MTEVVMQGLRDMGLSHIDAAAGNHPYIAVVDRGNVAYETSDFSLTSDFLEDTISGVSVTALSRNAEEGSGAQAILDLNNYVLQGPGLNIVIYDKAAGKKVDACYVIADAAGGGIAHGLPE